MTSRGDTKAWCPECSEKVGLPEGSKEGEVVSCPNCAGALFRLLRDDEGWRLKALKRTWCPVCRGDVILPDDAEDGDAVEHCGVSFRLTCEYGAYALEPSSE